MNTLSFRIGRIDDKTRCGKGVNTRAPAFDADTVKAFVIKIRRRNLSVPVQLWYSSFHFIDLRYCWYYIYVNWSAGEVADVALAVTTVTSTVPVPAGLVTVIEL